MSYPFSDNKYTQRDIWEYDENERLRRHERISEHYSHQTQHEREVNFSGYRPVQGSDLTWVNAPPAAKSWQSDFGKRLGISPAKEPKAATCPHGYQYVSQGYIVLPLGCDYCLRVVIAVDRYVVVPPAPFTRVEFVLPPRY